MEEPDDPVGMSLVHLLRAVTVELDLFGAEFARRHGLHATDVRALIALVDAERAGHPATPGWLARQLGLDSSSVTALVDRLQRLGHVRRRPDPDDRRRVLLELEDRATALGWSFFGPLISGAVGATRSFSPDEVATVERYLRAMLDVVTAGRTHPG